MGPINTDYPICAGNWQPAKPLAFRSTSIAEEEDKIQPPPETCETNQPPHYLETWELNYKLISVELTLAGQSALTRSQNSLPLAPRDEFALGAKLFLLSTLGFGLNLVGNSGNREIVNGQEDALIGYNEHRPYELSVGLRTPTLPLDEDGQFTVALFGEFDFGNNYILSLASGVVSAETFLVRENQILTKVRPQKYTVGLMAGYIGRGGGNTVGLKFFSQHQTFLVEPEAKVNGLAIPSQNYFGGAVFVDFSLLQFFYEDKRGR